MSVAAVLNIAGGTIGGLLGSTIYVEKEAPKYPSGLGATMALQVCLLGSCVLAWVVFGRANRRADRGEGDIVSEYPRWRWTL